MNNPYHDELSALFARDADALIDEAFVERCAASFRRARRRLLVLQLIIVCAVVVFVGSLLPWLADLGTPVMHRLSPALTALDSGIGRATLISVVVVLIVRRFGLPSFGLREARR
jgi:H+/Cl- antiporter ClcA